jgi:hypothetical protein
VLAGVCAASGVVLAGTIAWAVLSGAPRGPGRAYPARSAEEMIDSVALMIERREAERLPELIEVAAPGDTRTDREQMAGLYRAVGGVLGAVEDLALSIAERYPEELAELRGELEAARARGEATSILGAMLGGGRGGGRGGRGTGGERQFAMGFTASPEQRARTERAIAALLADPYTALGDARARLTTARIDDETAALLWDGRPVLPPLGLICREGEDGRWRIVPPTQQAVLSRFMPRTAEEYQIWGSLLKTMEQVAVDLRAEVEGGELGSLDELSDSAFEKLVIPAGMVMVAYGRAMEDRAEPRRAERPPENAGTPEPDGREP